jgi:CRISPR-associated protein Csm5
MPSLPFEPYELRIEPLSPIHIGAGQSLEPYEYEMAEDENGSFLRVLDLEATLSDLSDEDRVQFDKITRADNMPHLRQWLRRRATQSSHLRYTIEVQASAFEELSRFQDNPRRLGLIELFTRDANTGAPYIPGSSIKGAIRTALIEQVAHTRDSQTLIASSRGTRNSGARFEATVLGHMSPRGDVDLYRDPMRQIAISDAPLQLHDCYIDRMEIIGANRAEDIAMYRDVTWSLVDSDPREKDSVPAATSQFRLQRGYTDRARMGKDMLPQAFTIQEICRACNAFYRPKLETELEKFRTGDGVAERLLQAASLLGQKSCLVRLGRHSHYECMTVSFAPRIGGKTRTYVGGELPLGWARLTFEAA